MRTRPTKPAEIPPVLPIFPLSGALLLPFSQRPLNIFEPRYLDMVDAALAGDRMVGLVQPVDTSEESPQGAVPVQAIGCVGRLTHWEDNGDGRYFIVLEGVTRFTLVEEVKAGTPYRQARIAVADFSGDFEREAGQERVDRPRFLKMMRDYADYADFDIDWDEIERTGTADLVNFCCMVSPYGPREKQMLLEAELPDRAEMLIALAEMEMARGPSRDGAALN